MTGHAADMPKSTRMTLNGLGPYGLALTDWPDDGSTIDPRQYNLSFVAHFGRFPNLLVLLG